MFANDISDCLMSPVPYLPSQIKLVTSEKTQAQEGTDPGIFVSETNLKGQ